LSPPTHEPAGQPANKATAHGGRHLADVGANDRCLGGSAERGEARREGRGKSERSHRTGEAGEPTRGTPWREGERRITELLEGKTTGTPNPETTVSTKLQRIAELAREAPERAFQLRTILDQRVRDDCAAKP
jgi:hypothetical protein